MKMNKLLIISFLLSFLFFIGCTDIDDGFSENWACLDGCYEMQLIFEDEFNITKSPDRHDLCGQKCFEIYMGDMGNEENNSN